MENFRSSVEFTTISHHRCHSLSCQMMAESMQMEAQRGVIHCREKQQKPKCYYPADMPVVPEQAMEFLSRTWSPSSSDLFQILSPHSLRTSLEDCREDKKGGDEGEEKHLSTVHFSGCRRQTLGHMPRVLVSAKSQRKHKLIQSNWLNIGHMREWLRGYLFSNIYKACGGRRKREELRLQSAQAHAAVTVAQLAAAIAGVVSECQIIKPTTRSSECDTKLSSVLASAAALVATVCAEAAEIAGANRARVTSAMEMGLENRTSADLLTLTATAATCLRGAATLKLREEHSLSGSHSVQKETVLTVRMPCGRVRRRTVSIFPQRDTVMLRLGRKHLHGAFATHKNYRVLRVAMESGEGEAASASGSCFAVTLCTTGGDVQLLFDDHMRGKAWRSSVEHLL